MPDPAPMPGPTSGPDKFLSCDWGTSSFRLRLVQLRAANPSVLATIKSNNGIASTFEDWKTSDEDRITYYQSFLETQIKALQPSLDFSLSEIPLLISGMASSSIGIKELPYAPLPFDTGGNGLYWEIFEATEQSPRRTMLISGVRSADDVMRGEETQLIGCSTTARQEQIFMFPGTHSKHIRVKEGKVVDFSTYMTGEFFAILSQHSILSGSMTAGAEPHTSLGFYQGVAAGIHANLLHQPFLVRTRQLLEKRPKEENYAYLSGLLIGAECKDLTRTPTPITLVSDGPLQANYKRALEILGIKGVEVQELDEALIKGQAKIARFLGK
jgi:2-dehydro-3-deoxygalactonokinase